MTVSSDYAFDSETVRVAPRGAASIVVWPVILYAAALFAAVGGYAAGSIEASAARFRPEPELLVLLRFMAVVKLGLALGALALAHWRLGFPASRRLAGAAVLATALMLAGPGLIWHIGSVVAGACCFHAGLFLFLGVAWADRDAGALFRKVGRRSGQPQR